MRSDNGFTLIEFMIVIGIVGILATIAVPQYQLYTSRTKFSEVILATTKFKTAIGVCAVVQGGIPLDNTCTIPATNGLPPINIDRNSEIANIVIGTNSLNNAFITAQAVATGGLNSETFTLNGVYANHRISWSVDSSSTCLVKGLCSRN